MKKRITLAALLMICALVLMSFTAPASASISPLQTPAEPTAVMAEPVIGHPDYEQYLPAIMTEPEAETK